MNIKNVNIRHLLLIAAISALVQGCDAGDSGKETKDGAIPTVMSKTTPQQGPAPTEEELARARSNAAANAKSSRQAAAAMSFDEFEKKVFKEDFEGGKYIVNGDTPIASRKRLMEFYESLQREQEPVNTAAFANRLVVHQEGGQDSVWNDTQQRKISYCVSTSFGNNYAAVVADMAAAGEAWEQYADINFIHAASLDANCDASNASVVFDVRPVSVNGQYLARAFFPHEPRASRNVLIDDSAFDLTPGGTITLVGILRHELGHTLGFRHEHTRAESGTCFEDTDWRPLTNYDAFSVMHYPQCNGLGDWSLTLTHQDQNGAACLYGAAPGFNVDTEICPSIVNDTPASCPATTVVKSGSVAQDERIQFGPFAVATGSVFEAVMSGTGDPDLYVNFGEAPTFSKYICRPYLDGADETCSLDVPAGKTEAFLMIRGYRAGDYQLTISHTPGQ